MGVGGVEDRRGDLLQLEGHLHGLVVRERVVEGAQGPESSRGRVPQSTLPGVVWKTRKAPGVGRGPCGCRSRRRGRLVVEELVGEPLLGAAGEERSPWTPWSTQYELCVEMRQAASKAGASGEAGAAGSRAEQAARRTIAGSARRAGSSGGGYHVARGAPRPPRTSMGEEHVRPRRSRDHPPSSVPVASKAPREVVSIWDVYTPCCSSNDATDPARRWPSPRLYSVSPRGSARPDEPHPLARQRAAREAARERPERGVRLAVDLRRVEGEVRRRDVAASAEDAILDVHAPGGGRGHVLPRRGGGGHGRHAHPALCRGGARQRLRCRGAPGDEERDRGQRGCEGTIHARLLKHPVCRRAPTWDRAAFRLREHGCGVSR